MTKSIFGITLLLGALASLPADARRGGGRDDSRNDRGGSAPGRVDLVRGTQNWFLQESAEHLLRDEEATNATRAQTLSQVQVSLLSPAQTQVDLSFADAGPRQALCNMIDESSRGGSVLKKDVRCEGAPDRSGRDRPRGTRADQLGEAIEHSLRAERAARAVDFVKASAQYNEAATAIAVELLSVTNERVGYLCQVRGGSSVSCRK